MYASRRHEIMQDFFESEEETLRIKGREYTLGAELDNDKDTLANFKNVGDMVQHTCSNCNHTEAIGPRKAWAVYFLKHVFSLLTHTAQADREISEPIHGRINDIRTYATLYACIDEDERIPPNVAEADIS